jgi:hypothetical protein
MGLITEDASRGTNLTYWVQHHEPLPSCCTTNGKTARKTLPQWLIASFSGMDSSAADLANGLGGQCWYVWNNTGDRASAAHW